MQTARQLAELALRIAAGLQTSDVKGFHWRSTAIPHVEVVFIELSDGSMKRYIVHEDVEGGRDSSGVSP